MRQFLRAPASGDEGSLSSKPDDASYPLVQLSKAAGASANPSQPDALPGNLDELVERLATSPFYQIYRNSFQAATGLPCHLVAAGSPSAARSLTSCHTAFCRVVNSGGSPCRRCLAAHSFLLTAAQRRTMSIECTAGLTETAIPLLVDGFTAGYLMTGQVLTRELDHLDFVKSSAGTARLADDARKLRELYRQVPRIDRASYRWMVELLIDVRIQIAPLVGRIASELRTGDSDPLRRWMEAIVEQLGNDLGATSIARQAGMTGAQDSQLLLRSIGMTAAQFIELQRVGLAKLDLLTGGYDIPAVAEKLGFRSALDLDRSFKKLVGISAAAYRTRMRLAMFPHLSV